ncbi:Uncharacterised protein [Burkholderia oklahomensis]|nr:Uncharacterised protein [Burkholderia oklahomensis]
MLERLAFRGYNIEVEAIECDADALGPRGLAGMR